MSAETIAAGRYRVERKLGDGAMAKVFLARDGELNRLVAVKVLDEQLAADETFRARFSRESRVAAGLSHPNVVTVFDVGEADGLPFIVMEYVDGRTLDDRIREEGPLPPDEVARLGRQVCAGLEHAHEHGLVHRDLKPGNLIERVDGTVKIGDFGIARAAEETELTEAGTILGTAAYLAPEQAEGGPVTPQTDLFALGLVLYELLAARRPWEVERLPDLARRRKTPPAPLPRETPPGLAEAISRCLEPEPEDRPASAGDVATLLDGPEGSDTDATMVLPRTEPARTRTRARSSRGLWPVALAAALVLGLGALAAAIVTGGDDGRSGTPAPTTPARIAPPAKGANSAEDARNLSKWLRENAR